VHDADGHVRSPQRVNEVVLTFVTGLGERPMALKNDMTWMYTVHAALRRELERMARVTARADDDPVRVLRTAAGWEMFKSYLHVHHTAEDTMLWPPMRSALAAESEGMALLDAMEAEHATIDPLLDAIDAALLDRESGPQRLGELTDTLPDRAAPAPRP
jgi:hypothetical protein